MRKNDPHLASVAFAAVLALFSILAFAATSDAGESELAPRVFHWVRSRQPSGSNAAAHVSGSRTRNSSGNGIIYHGGPVILGTTKVYYIWYGDWAGNTATTILPALAQSIGGSSYFNINTSYYDGADRHVSNAVAYGGAANDAYSRGKILSDADVEAIAQGAISAGKLPFDANGVYFVLTSADVSESSGFCSQYCGWHSVMAIPSGSLKYAFIGNADRCPSSCEAQTTSPNGNAGADAMVSIVAHELEESVTDPELDAWYDRRGEENADKCAWTYGATGTASNGARYNVVLSGQKFLIQQNWVNASGGYCALSY